MATNLALNNDLLNEAVKVGGMGTKKATVTMALEEFIRRRKIQNIIDEFGKVDFDSGYDYKAERKREE